jgi:hypothetical protein
MTLSHRGGGGEHVGLGRRAQHGSLAARILGTASVRLAVCARRSRLERIVDIAESHLCEDDPPADRVPVAVARSDLPGRS